MKTKNTKLFTKKQLQAFGELMFEEGRKFGYTKALAIKYKKSNKKTK